MPAVITSIMMSSPLRFRWGTFGSLSNEGSLQAPTTSALSRRYDVSTANSSECPKKPCKQRNGSNNRTRIYSLLKQVHAPRALFISPALPCLSVYVLYSSPLVARPPQGSIIIYARHNPEDCHASEPKWLLQLGLPLLLSLLSQRSGQVTYAQMQATVSMGGTLASGASR